MVLNTIIYNQRNVSKFLEERHQIVFLVNDSIQYWIWQLVMSKLHEGMSFQFWYQMLNQKILKNQIFTSFFFKTLKFCTFWYIIQLVNTVDQMLTFSFSNVQISNDILLVSLIITEYNAECHRIYCTF